MIIKLKIINFVKLFRIKFIKIIQKHPKKLKVNKLDLLVVLLKLKEMLILRNIYLKLQKLNLIVILNMI